MSLPWRLSCFLYKWGWVGNDTSLLGLLGRLNNML